MKIPWFVWVLAAWLALWWIYDDCNSNGWHGCTANYLDVEGSISDTVR